VPEWGGLQVLGWAGWPDVGFNVCEVQRVSEVSPERSGRGSECLGQPSSHGSGIPVRG
jgi:hypothetical protein